MKNLLLVALRDFLIKNGREGVTSDSDERIEKHDNVDDRGHEEDEPLEVIVIVKEDFVEIAERGCVGHADGTDVFGEILVVPRLIRMIMIHMNLHSISSRALFNVNEFLD